MIPLPTAVRARCAAAIILALGATSVTFTRMAAAVEVVTQTPAAYARAIPRNLEAIEIVFDEAISVPALPIRVAGTMSGLDAGNWNVSGDRLVYTPGGTFLAGEKVRVHLHRDIVGLVSGTNLGGGHYFSFTVASAPSGLDFSNYAVYGASVIPYFIHGGDLDEDGRPDLAVPNEGTDDVSVFLNDSGLGQFDDRSDYGVGQKPSCVFGDDFDNDGWQDLATADIQGSTMSVLLNQGDGTFAPSVGYPTDADDCRQVHGADFDGDLDIDLVATSHSTTVGRGEIWLFYNQGDGTFFPGVSVTTVGDGAFTVEVEDYDGDGHPDIAVGCREADRVTILRNGGTGASFTRTGDYAAGNGPWDTDANDVDGDGDVDLVFANSFGNRLGVLRNDGSGSFAGTQYVTAAFPIGVHLADLDGDGHLDALSSNFSGANAQIFLNDGVGGFVLFDALEVQLSGSYPWASDLDADGDLDVTVIDENSDLVFIFYNDDIAAGGPKGGAALAPGLTARPNPMRSESGVRFYFANATLASSLRVVSATGRIVVEMDELERGDGGVFVEWDGRDRRGRPVTPGRYFIQVDTVERGTLTGEVLVLD